MFKKSMKVIASAIAAVMAAATVLTTAAKADVMYDTYDSTASVNTQYDSYSYDNNYGYAYGFGPYDVYDFTPNYYTISYDAFGNKIITYADGTVIYEMLKVDSTYDFDKVSFDASDYVVSYANQSSAEKAAGFTISAPDSTLALFPYKQYSVISGSILQITYSDLMGNEVIIRKAIGKLDISGDSTMYTVENKAMLNNAATIMSGNSYGYYKTIAAKNGYCYSIETNVPMTRTDMENIVKAIAK